MPVFAARVAHAAVHRGAADMKRWRLGERCVERGLDQEACVANARQKVAKRTGVPCTIRRRPRTCGLREEVGRHRQSQRHRRGGAQEFTTVRHGGLLTYRRKSVVTEASTTQTRAVRSLSERCYTSLFLRE